MDVVREDAALLVAVAVCVIRMAEKEREDGPWARSGSPPGPREYGPAAK